jgi:hypothetical protein
MHLRSRKLKNRESKGTPPPSPTEEQSPGPSPSSTSPENSPNSISGEQFGIFGNLFNFSEPKEWRTPSTQKQPGVTSRRLTGPPQNFQGSSKPVTWPTSLRPQLMMKENF